MFQMAAMVTLAAAPAFVPASGIQVFINGLEHVYTVDEVQPTFYLDALIGTMQFRVGTYGTLYTVDSSIFSYMPFSNQSTCYPYGSNWYTTPDGQWQVHAINTAAGCTPGWDQSECYSCDMTNQTVTILPTQATTTARGHSPMPASHADGGAGRGHFGGKRWTPNL